MEKIKIKHTGTPADAEAKLELAADSVKRKIEQDKKVLSDKYLKKCKDETDTVVKRIIDNMIKEIADAVAIK